MKTSFLTGQTTRRTPEGANMSLILGYDPETLREQVDLDACRARLAELGEQRSLSSLLERVWLLKVLDRLEDALVISEESVRVARMAGTRKDLLRSRILHATINQCEAHLPPPNMNSRRARPRPRGRAGLRSPPSRCSTAARRTSTPASSSSPAPTSSAHCSCGKSRVRPMSRSSRRSLPLMLPTAAARSNLLRAEQVADGHCADRPFVDTATQCRTYVLA